MSHAQHCARAVAKRERKKKRGREEKNKLVDRLIVPQRYPIPTTSEYMTLHSKRDLAEAIKDTDPKRRLPWIFQLCPPHHMSL